jgi:hypothetical protein
VNGFDRRRYSRLTPIARTRRLAFLAEFFREWMGLLLTRTPPGTRRHEWVAQDSARKRPSGQVRIVVGSRHRKPNQQFESGLLNQVLPLSVR